MRRRGLGSSARFEVAGRGLSYEGAGEVYSGWRWSLNRWEERQVLRDLDPKKPGGLIRHDTVFVTIAPDKAIQQIGFIAETSRPCRMDFLPCPNCAIDSCRRSIHPLKSTMAELSFEWQANRSSGDLSCCIS